MSHNSFIFDLIGMKLSTCIPILNRHVVKFKETENIEKKVAKFCLSWSPYLTRVFIGLTTASLA